MVFAKIISSNFIGVSVRMKIFVRILSRVLDQLIILSTLIAGGYYGLFVLYVGVSTLLLRCWKNMNSYENKDRIIVYRQLQIWEKALSNTLKGRLFGIAMFVVPIIQVFAFTVLITFGSNLLWYEVGFVGSIAIDAVVCSFSLVSYASLLLICSSKWLIGYRDRSVCNKYERRVAKSFRPLRVEFGSNYVDRMTALILQDNCWRQIISINLVVKGVR